MSLSAKDFNQAADILRAERLSADGAYRPGMSGEQHKATARYTLDLVENALIAWFQAENPRFDPARFRRASQP